MQKHYGFVYLTIDLKNGKGYIGKHKIRNQKTLDPKYIGSGTIIKDMKNKYGLNRFNRQILCFCESKEELNEMEIYYINYFNAVKSENFYNIADGGDAGNRFAGKTEEEMKEIKKNISEMQKKRYEDPKEIEKLSKMSSGEKNGRAKNVYCNELNIIFSYVGLAEEYCRNVLNIKIGKVSRACNGYRNFTGKLIDGTKLTWNWLEDVDQEILDNAEYIDSKKYEAK